METFILIPALSMVSRVAARSNPAAEAFDAPGGVYQRFKVTEQVRASENVTAMASVEVLARAPSTNGSHTQEDLPRGECILAKFGNPDTEFFHA